jgi:ankyrin repeat protein
MNGANLEQKEQYGNPPLCGARWELPIAEALVRAGANVNSVGRDGESPLHCAPAAVASLLLDNGAFIEARDDRGETPLEVAVIDCGPEDVRLLLDRGARRVLFGGGLNSDFMGLILEGWEGYVDIILVLLDYGASVNAMPGSYAPLVAASSRGYLKLVKRFLELGAHVDAVRPGGETALMCAARGGYSEIVSALLDAGANSVLTDNDGRTAAMIAEEGGHLDIAKILADASEGWEVGK